MTMNKISYNLRAVALEELYAIRDTANEVETRQLDFYALRPGDRSRSLLGQLSCGIADRRLKFYQQAIQPFTNYGAEIWPLCPFTVNTDNDRPCIAIEAYMGQPWAENMRVVKFLKGEIQELTVDML